MTGELTRVAMVSMHTSPTSQAGRGDAGGMNVAILATARALAARGLEVDLLTRAEAEPVAVELAPGVVLRTLAAGPARPVSKAELADVTDDFGEAVATLVGRVQPRYQVLHAHYWLSGLATLPVALELGLPFVQSFHTLAAMKNRSLADGDTPEPDRRRFTEGYLANQADAIVAGSAPEVDSLIDDLRAPADKLWVIPPGVDTELFTPARAVNSAAVRRALGLHAVRPLVVVAARIQPLKGQDLAVMAMAEVAVMRGSAPVLVFAGEPTAGAELYRASVIALAEDLGVEVAMVGSLDQQTLANLFAAASVTLVPSHSETFGLVALESAASGTPVVGSRSTGLVASISDGQSGMLLASRDPREWARAISALLDDPHRLAELGESARAHAEGFTWATAAASLMGVYQSLLPSPAI